MARAQEEPDDPLAGLPGVGAEAGPALLHADGQHLPRSTARCGTCSRSRRRTAAAASAPCKHVPRRGAVRRRATTSSSTTARSGIRAATPETQKDLQPGAGRLRRAVRHRLRQGDAARSGPGAADPRELPAACGSPTASRMALIIDFAETLAPGGRDGAPVRRGPLRAGHAGEVGARPAVPRRATSPSCCIAENLADVSPRIARNPYVAQHRDPAARPRRSGWSTCATSWRARSSQSHLGRAAGGPGEDDRRPLAHQPGPAAHRGDRARRAHHPRAAQGEEEGDHPGRVPRAAGVHRAGAQRSTRWPATPRPRRCCAHAAERAEEGPHRGDADGLPRLRARWAPARRSWSPASPATSASRA